MNVRSLKPVVFLMLACLTLLSTGAGVSEAGPGSGAASPCQGGGKCMYLPLIFKNWPPLPGAPVLSPITIHSFDGYEMTWTDAVDADYYVLQEDVTASFANPKPVATGVNAPFREYRKPAGYYCYRVRATNEYGNSSWSNSRCVSLPQLVDDFTTPANGWPVDSYTRVSYSYESGEFRILAKEPEYVFAAGPDVLVAGDFRSEIDARSAWHFDGTYGLVFGSTDAGYYLFEVGYGEFDLFRYERSDRHWVELIGPQWHPAIRQGTASNRLAVERRGATIILYVNGTQVGQKDDTVFPTGYTGVAAVGYSPNYDARFDNFVLRYVGSAVQAAGAGGEWSRAVAPARFHGPK